MIFLVAAAAAVPALLKDAFGHSHADDDMDSGFHLHALTESQSRHAMRLISKNCTPCHGDSLEGNVGPSLQQVGQRYTADRIDQIIRYGKGKKKDISMPAGLVSDEDAELLAIWLSIGKPLIPPTDKRPGS